jgi:hypothetical protein
VLRKDPLTEVKKHSRPALVPVCLRQGPTL